eukprot:UN15403
MKMLKILQYGQANNDLVVGYRLGGGFLADKDGTLYSDIYKKNMDNMHHLKKFKV